MTFGLGFWESKIDGFGVRFHFCRDGGVDEDWEGEIDEDWEGERDGDREGKLDELRISCCEGKVDGLRIDWYGEILLNFISPLL